MVEVQVTEQGTFVFLVDKMDVVIAALGMGFSIAMVVVVVVAAIKLGWKFWPWILVAGFLAFMFA